MCVAARNRQNLHSVQNHPRSFKVIAFCANRKRMYNFLLVINSRVYFVFILHRFWDTATYSFSPAFILRLWPRWFLLNFRKALRILKL